VRRLHLRLEFVDLVLQGRIILRLCRRGDHQRRQRGAGGQSQSERHSCPFPCFGDASMNLMLHRSVFQMSVL
jgi:hypothetical protein